MSHIVKMKSSIITVSMALIVLLFSTGCEELLNEALQKDITVEETLFANSTETAQSETMPISDGAIVLGGSPKLSKASVYQMLSYDAENSTLIAWVLSEGGGQVRGNITNNNGSSVDFKVYVNTTDDFGTAELIGSLSVAGGATTDFSFSGADLEAYFENHFDDGFGTIYLFLSAEASSTPNLVVNSIEFWIQAAASLSKTIEANAEYAGYADSIQDITDYTLSGEIRNNSATEVTSLLRISPVGGTDPFTPFEVEAIIQSGQTLDLSNWAGLFTEAELAAMNTQFTDALTHLASNAIIAELFLTCDGALNVEVVSIGMSGTVSVGL